MPQKTFVCTRILMDATRSGLIFRAGWKHAFIQNVIFVYSEEFSYGDSSVMRLEGVRRGTEETHTEVVELGARKRANGN